MVSNNFFSQKIIFIEIWYKTNDSKLLAIIKAFKTWKYYLESYKYKVLMFTNHNNLQHFLDIKSRSSK